MKGLVISFEGLDGVGKTTQIRLLEAELLSRNLEVTVYRDEPLVYVEDLSRVGIFSHIPEVLATLYVAQTLSKRPLYTRTRESGRFLLVDRAIDTCVVYNDWLVNPHREPGSIAIPALQLYRLANTAEKPDITFLLCLSASTRYERLKAKDEEPSDLTRFNQEHHWLTRAYSQRALDDPQRFRVIDCEDQTTAQIAYSILSHLEGSLRRTAL